MQPIIQSKTIIPRTFTIRGNNTRIAPTVGKPNLIEQIRPGIARRTRQAPTMVTIFVRFAIVGRSFF